MSPVVGKVAANHRHAVKGTVRVLVWSFSPTRFCGLVTDDVLVSTIPLFFLEKTGVMRYAWLLLVLRPLVQTREFKSTLGFLAGCLLSVCSLTTEQHDNSDVGSEAGTYALT